MTMKSKFNAKTAKKNTICSRKKWDFLPVKYTICSFKQTLQDLFDNVDLTFW